jgi:phthiodiolone/phenolphthiodiolone dimycocerosates ketoreductase
MRVATLLGASAIWAPDHFMGFAPRWLWTPEIVPPAKLLHSMDALFDPIPILTLAARRHRRAWIGTSVTDPIRRHPMSLAQTFATLDHIARGRAILGLGNGLRENTEPYGLPFEQRLARFEEALTIIRLLWESGGKPVTYAGRFWRLKDAVFDLPLYRGTAPRLFIGAHFPRMLKLTGRFADGWLPGEKIGGEGYAGRLQLIREAAVSAGRSMASFMPCQTLLIAFGSGKDAVMKKALTNKYVAYNALGLPPAVWTECGLEHPFAPKFEGFLELVPSRVGPEAVDAALARLTPDLLDRLFYMGSPDEIAAAAAPLAAAGCRHFIVANLGSAFTGEGLADLWRMGKLMRLLKRL